MTEYIRLLTAPLLATLVGWYFLYTGDTETALWNSIMAHLYINISVTIINFFYGVYEILFKGEIETHRFFQPATLDKEAPRRPFGPGTAAFAIGIPHGPEEIEVKEAVEETFGVGVEAVYAEDVYRLNAFARKNKIPAIMLDKTVTAADIKNSDFREYVQAIGSALNELNIKDLSRRRLESLMRVIKETLRAMKRVNIDEGLRIALSRQCAKDTDALKSMMKKRKADLAKLYNNEPIDTAKQYEKKTVVAITEEIARSNPFAFDNFQKGHAAGITNCFIYGDRYRTRKEAEEFIAACGYEGNLSDIVFIDRRGLAYQDLVARIKQEAEARSGVRINRDSNIGIIAAADDGLLKEGERAQFGTLLEVQTVAIKDKVFCPAYNSYQTILKVMAELGREGMTLENITIPGVTIDRVRGIFRYLPRALAIDYEKEIELYRRVVETVLKAA